jgi:serine/threonine protein kinase
VHNASSNGPSSDESPPQVPDYDLLRPIGEGGFGRVWLAANRTTGRLRAIKLVPLRGRGTTDPAGREIVSLTRLGENVRRHHPHLLDIDHVGQTEEFLFYVMDPADEVAGGPASATASYRPATLESRIHDGPLSPELCLDYARQLVEGLAALHAAGVVHRDVKPANCLFADGDLKLADFGLVATAGPQVSRVGTRTYMPPDGHMDARADVYAAGLVIYEMVTGMAAEDFPSPGARARTIAESPILTMLNRLVLRACEPDPSRRFADASAMLAEMTMPISAAATVTTRGRRIAAVVLVGLLVAGSLAVYKLWPTMSGGIAVNFITEPYEATIQLDGKPLVDRDGVPFTTPCTVPDLPSGVHHVVFQHGARGSLDAGEIDFAKTREVEISWDAQQ